MISPLSNEAKSTLLDILSLRADMELAMVEMYSPWLVNAPTVDGRLFVAKLVSDELNHAWQLSRIIQEFKPEGEKIVDELKNLRLGLHKLEAFNLPLFNWDDVLAFTFLVDKAGIYMLEALRNYEPLSKVVENMIKEEELHVTYSINELKHYENKVRMHGALQFWFARVLDMFSSFKYDIRVLQLLGIKEWYNDTTKTTYINEVNSILKGLGISELDPTKLRLSK